MKRFDCPHCGESIWMDVDIEIRGLMKDKGDDADWRDTLDAEAREYIQRAEASGLLAAFEVAVRRAKLGQMPQRIDKFFWTFVKTCAPKRVPSFVMDHYAREFRCTLAFYSAQGVMAVVGDGRMRAFLPQTLAVGTNIRKSGVTGAVGRIDADENQFHGWVRSRFGYVPAGASLFLEALRKKAAGEFADVRL